MGTEPRVGEASDEYRAVCVYSRDEGDPQCGSAATVHVLTDCAPYGLVALTSCDNHAPIARVAGEFRAEHVHEGFCGFPATIWHLAENRCVLDDSGAEPLLVAAAAYSSARS